jgi:hypothetical protein
VLLLLLLVLDDRGSGREHGVLPQSIDQNTQPHKRHLRTVTGTPRQMQQAQVARLTQREQAANQSLLYRYLLPVAPGGVLTKTNW